MLKKKLNIPGEVDIERGHRVGKKTKAGRHLGNASQSREQKPRPIVAAKISSCKVKENVLREARRKRPEDIMFLDDLSKRTLERRQELIPEMLEARKQGKIAYMVMDKLIIHDRKKPDDDNSCLLMQMDVRDVNVFTEQGTNLRPANGSSGISVPAHFCFTLFMRGTDVYGNLSYNLLSTVFCFHIFDDGKVIMHM